MIEETRYAGFKQDLQISRMHFQKIDENMKSENVTNVGYNNKQEKLL